MKPLSKPAKVGIVAAIVIAISAAFVGLFRYMNPGVFMPYKCNQGGDSSRKFYGDNWQARGAVCDGYWIPIGTDTNGKQYPAILAKMAQSSKPTTTEGMRQLAETSAKSI